MHDNRIIANLNSVGAAVKIDVLIQISAIAQANISGLGQANSILNGSRSFHGQNGPVKNSSQPNAGHGGYPPEQGKEQLFNDVSANTA